MLPWGKRAERVKHAEELLCECCQRLELDEKILGRSGREWIARRQWSDDTQEMRRLIYYAALTAPENVVEAAHFPPRRICDHEAYTNSNFDEMALEDMVDQKVDHFFQKLGNIEVHDVYKAVMRRVERPLIRRCLKWAKGNQVKAARVLGINRNTLKKKIEELEIE